MPVRITNNATNAQLGAQIARGRGRVAAAQERISSGKRINRPSDDPAGAGAVLRIRTSQKVVAQYQGAVSTVKDRLLVADTALNSYQLALDRARALMTKGASDAGAGLDARAALAAEIDGIRARVISIADTRGGDEYVFGGTRQNAPPFDPATGAAAVTPAARQLVQLEPGAQPLAAGVTAEGLFSDADGTVLETLATVAAALRGTGDEAADKAALNAGLDRLDRFDDLAHGGRITLGVGIQSADAAAERLGQSTLAYEAAAERVEGADFVESALEMKNAQQALDAAMQAGAYVGRRSLLDYLG